MTLWLASDDEPNIFLFKPGASSTKEQSGQQGQSAGPGSFRIPCRDMTMTRIMTKELGIGQLTSEQTVTGETLRLRLVNLINL